MIWRELYIDNEPIDLAEDTDVTLEINSNLFADISDIESNKSFSIQVPRTARNERVLTNCDMPSNDTNFPYQFHDARYYLNGVEIISKGKAVVLGVNDNKIELSLVWGICSGLKQIFDGNKSLQDLSSKETILWNKFNTTDALANLICQTGASAFYCKINPVQYNNSVVKPANWVDVYSTSKAISHIGSMAYLLPCVPLNWLLNQISADYGINLSFLRQDDKNKLNDLFIPLTTTKSNELSLGSNARFDATITTSNSIGRPHTFNITQGLNIFNETGSTNRLTSKVESTIHLDINAKFNFSVNVNVESVLRDIRRNLKLQAVVTGTATNDTYNISSAISVVKTGSNNYYVTFAGTADIDIEPNDRIEFRFNKTILEDWTSTGAYFTRFTADQSGSFISIWSSIPEMAWWGSNYPIVENLPDIKVIDFIKFICAITGTFPKQIDDNTTTLHLYPIHILWSNITNAKDWSEKLIPLNRFNTPRAMQYILADWAKKNIYKWDNEDDVINDYNGYITIKNDTLEEEKVVFEFPFSASEGNNIPLVELPDGETDPDKYLWDERTQDVLNLQSAGDRVMRLVPLHIKTSEGEVAGAGFAGVFDASLNMNNIITEKYSKMAESLQSVKVLTEHFRLNDIEIKQFDETIPIYLSQYGRYYAVTKITRSDDGIAEVQLYQLTTD